MLGKDRLITAAIALPILAGGILFLPPAAFAVLLGLVAAVGQWEFYRFHFKDGLPPFAWLGCAAGVGVVYAAIEQEPLLGVAVGCLVALTGTLFSRQPLPQRTIDAGMVLCGLLYVAVLLSFMGLLREADTGGRWLFYLLLITWAGDAMAYYVGRTIGRLPLTQISPKKTVEGTIGGIAACVAAAYLGSALMPSAMNGWDPLWIGLLLGVMALLGDLVESTFKRGAGVKDSSNLIPAHGGMLDKLDAFLFTGPALYFYLHLFVWSRGAI